MTIKDLIEKLKEFDQEMLVVTHGYEGGYENTEPHIVDIVFNENAKNDGTKDKWYYGIHGDGTAIDYEGAVHPMKALCL